MDGAVVPTVVQRNRRGEDERLGRADGTLHLDARNSRPSFRATFERRRVFSLDFLAVSRARSVNVHFATIAATKHCELRLLRYFTRAMHIFRPLFLRSRIPPARSCRLSTTRRLRVA